MRTHTYIYVHTDGRTHSSVRTALIHSATTPVVTTGIDVVPPVDWLL